MSPQDRYESLDETLYGLRWFAVVGQLAALAVAWWGLRLELAWPPLILGAAALGFANALFGLWRTRSTAHGARAGLGLALDLIALTWALYFSGGVANPFVQLYLVPLALATTALPASRVVALAVAAGLGYALLSRYAPPLAHQHGAVLFNLHLTGMAVNFALGLMLFSVFGLGLARRLRERDAALGRTRERRLRDEGLHALALQSASAAHDLNTPLNTLSLLVDEWRATPHVAPSKDDLLLMAEQLAFARDAVRRLAASTRETPPPQSLEGLLMALRERLQLLRPQAHLALSIDPSLAYRQVQPPLALWGSLGHLLENAADAGLSRGDARLHLQATPSPAGGLRLALRDHGPGFDSQAPRHLGERRPDGLGLGLAIADATVEHLGGQLRVQPLDEGGSLTVLDLPWSALSIPEESGA